VLDPAVLAVALAAGFIVALAGVALRPALVVSFPRSVLVILAGLSLLAAWPLVELDPLGLRLEIDPSTEPLLPRRDPARAAYRDAIRNFGDDEVYVIAMVTDDVFRADRLGTLRSITDQIARLPEVRRVQSLTDVVAFRWVPEEDWLEIGNLIDEIPQDGPTLASLRRETLGHPLYRRSLVSDDGSTAAINVTFHKMTDLEFIESGLDDRIAAILAKERTAELTFHVAGRPHVKARVYRWMLRDLRVLVPSSLGVLAVGLWLVFGTRRGVVLPLAVVLTATLWTFGAIAALERPLSVLTTLLAPMLIAIGSVYVIHALSRYEEEAGRAPTPRAAALASLQHLRLPVLVAGSTTMVGFAALLITDVPAVFELGALSVLGVASITLLTLSGMHAALALAPLRAPGTGLAGPAERIAAILEAGLGRLGSATNRYARVWLVGFGCAALVALLLIPRIEIDTDYLSYFDADAPVRLDFEAVNARLSGAVPIYVTLGPDAPGRFREPEVLRSMERLQRASEQIPLVSRTHSLVDTIRVMNRALSADDPAAERIPDTRPAVAELLFLAPKGDLDRYTNANHSRANVLVRSGAVGTSSVRALTDALADAVAAAGLPPDVEVELTGNALLLARSADGIALGQPRSVGLAAVTILVLITCSMGSLRLGLVAMIPNAAPVLMFYGLLGAGLAPLSLPTSLIGCVALGIAVDDTVHYLVRYRAERRAGHAPDVANRICVRRIGRPIAITSAMLMAGFLVVGLSSFATLRQFGLLSAATMGLCLMSDLVLLPALLRRTAV
jgi:hydrophobe/amphiphile efflux-3 (HAE3) family protein